ALAAERSVDAVLERLVEVARTLAGARYAALGVPDGDGSFARFLTAGMTGEEVAAMGPLPRTHGLLGAMLESRESIETARLYDRSRELSAIEERNRLARDLHDSVVQKLLRAVAQARGLRPDPGRAARGARGPRLGRSA
ncbi:MAG: histidine kinase, partial [Thermoleophilaceae bacterium]